MRINIHAGHNPDGKVACGAVGLIKESTEARKVKDLVVARLRELGHTVYDCTVDNGTSQSDVLNKIIAKCNAHTVDLDVSIHFNSGASDKTGNGATTGVEVLLYSTTSKAKSKAESTVKAISALGFRNRGIKYRTDLAFLRRTNSPAMLIECCFVDDADDIKLYNPTKMAAAIVTGITGVAVTITNCKPAVAQPTLKRGAKGDQVVLLQQDLNYVAKANLSVDGSFGGGTETAVKNWQKANGLTADGSYGPASYRKMSELLK